MQIDVTQFLQTECMRDFSASQAESGPTAGYDTWCAARDTAPDYPLPEDAHDTFRAFALSSGGWEEEEIAGWNATELTALFLQWAAGDARECGLDRGASWDDIRALQEEGQAPSTLWLGDGGRIYFDVGV